MEIIRSFWTALKAAVSPLTAFLTGTTAGLLRLRFTQLDICSAAQSVRYADVRFRTSSGLLLSRQYYRFAQRLQIYQQSRQHTGLFGLYLPALGSGPAARFYRQPVFVACFCVSAKDTASAPSTCVWKVGLIRGQPTKTAD